MANYYQYKFISPDPLYSRIKEEMRSYFEARMVDDLLFPIYLDDALRKLGKGTIDIQQAILFIDNFEARLPPDFFDVRECWAIFEGTSLYPYKVPGSFYKQITTVLNKPYNECDPAVNCDPCNPDIITVVSKTNTEVNQTFRLKYLLTPGNIKTRGYCDHGSLNLGIRDTEKFHINGNKLSTEFREGEIYLVYYAKQEDCSGNQMIPDNYRIEQFILAYIKAKLFEFLWNTTSDETYNQALQRYQIYQQKSDEAYIMADIEMKKETIYQKAYRINRDRHRYDGYERMMYGSYYNRFRRR
jgi:hypothetical protein